MSIQDMFMKNQMMGSDNDSDNSSEDQQFDGRGKGGQVEMMQYAKNQKQNQGDQIKQKKL